MSNEHRPQKPDVTTQETGNSSPFARFRNHALAASVAINIVFGFILVLTFTQSASLVKADLELGQTNHQSWSSMFDFYTKALDKHRDAVFVLSSVYCKGLPKQECQVKLGVDAKKIGGETWERYQLVAPESSTAHQE